MTGTTTPSHDISAIVFGSQVTNWQTYEITVDMTRPCDSFSMRVPFSREVWDLLQPDLPIKILVDNTAILTGFIDEELVPEDDESVEIVGRCKVGRLVKESAPSLNFAGLGIKELITAVAGEWFDFVTFSNARNRAVIRGKGRKSKAAGEPVKLNTRVNTQISPGQKRWEVIETLCKQAGFLCWSSGDGRELIVGEPNFVQEPQFRFFMPAKNSRRTDEATVRGMGVHRSTADRYSRIICVGAGSGTDANYGSSVAARYGEAKDNPITPEGDGEDFSAPCRLVIQRPVQSSADARKHAEREMAERDAHGEGMTVRCAGHGQVVDGIYTTLFAPDTIASCEDERTGTVGLYLIVSCTYRSGREGEETVMRLVPIGTELVTG